MIVCIEGLPGSGKTTSAPLLAARIAGTALCETTHNHPFLETVYDDSVRVDLPVELGFLLLHNSGYRSAVALGLSVVMDFSPGKDRVFAELMLTEDDLTVFRSVYTRLYEAMPEPDVTLFLDASPSLCAERVDHRRASDPSRDFEARLTISKLQEIQAAYESHLDGLGKRVLRLPVSERDGEEDVAAGLAALLSERL